MDLRKRKYYKEDLAEYLDIVKEFIDLIKKINEKSQDENFKCYALRGAYYIDGEILRYEQYYKINGENVKGEKIIEKYLKEHFNTKKTIGQYYGIVNRLKNQNLLPMDLELQYKKAIRELPRLYVGNKDFSNKRASEVLSAVKKLYSYKGKKFDFTGIFGTYDFGDLTISFQGTYYDEESNEKCSGQVIISEILKDELDIDYNLFSAIRYVIDCFRKGILSNELVDEFKKYGIIPCNANFGRV